MGCATVEENSNEPVDAARRILNDRLGDWIASAGMLHYHGGEDRVIGCCGAIHPSHDLARGIRESFKDIPGHGAMRSASIACPQGLLNGTPAEVRATAFVGNRKTVAPDRDRLSRNPREPNAAGSDDDYTAVLAGVGAQTCDRRVACEGD